MTESELNLLGQSPILLPHPGEIYPEVLVLNRKTIYLDVSQNMFVVLHDLITTI